MDDKTWMGSLAEAKVAADLTYRKFNVFNQQSGKAPFDLVAHKGDRLLRISVKCCNTKNTESYAVQLRSIRHNRTENRIIPFDSESCDYMAVYLLDIDKICYIKADDLKGRAEVRLRETTSKYISKSIKQWLIDDYKDI